MSSSKKIDLKGTLRLLSECRDRRYSQLFLLVFSTKLCELLPLKPSLLINSTPLPCVKVQYICTDRVWRVESCWRPYSAGEPYIKLLDNTKQKPRRRGGSKVPLLVNLLR